MWAAKPRKIFLPPPPTNPKTVPTALTNRRLSQKESPITEPQP